AGLPPRRLLPGSTHAARKEANSRQRRDSDEQRERQYAELAGLAVANECEECESERFHVMSSPYPLRSVLPVVRLACPDARTRCTPCAPWRPQTITPASPHRGG